MYSLFIDTLSSPAFICLFDAQKNIKESTSWEGRHAEFDTLIESIDTLLGNNILDYRDLESIACIVGPGGFTGIRVTTLVANTLSYSFGIPLCPITVNDFFEYQGSPLPWMLPLTKTEVVLWEKQNTHPLIVKISTLDESISYTTNQIFFSDNKIPYSQADDYQLFLQKFPFTQTVSILYPLYARDPNVLVKK